jgi:ABC-type multidrug transport system ATPase subunit
MNGGEPKAEPSDGDWPDIDLPENEQVTVGRSGECRVTLTRASISRIHATLLRQGGHLKVEDAGSRFGTIVNGHPIKLKVLAAGDIVRFGSSPPYRFDGTRLVMDQSAQGMSVHIAGLEVTRGRRRLLAGVDLDIPGGSFVGILGPSGGGKSLLLGCLSDTLKPSAGRVLFDNNREIEQHRDYYRSKLGFVPQEDIIHEKLTVRENLWFAARMRFPEAPREALGKKIAGALDAVDMSRQADKRAGVLSGGQKKRVSIAVELLTQPRLLLLDEPTSGLDPGTGFRLMDNLRSLSRRGITVVCVTHTTDTINFFDSLAVLGFRDGVSTIVYRDAPEQLLSHFAVHSLPDLFDKLQSGVDPEPEAIPRNAANSSREDSSGGGRAAGRRTTPAAVFKRPEAEGRYFLSQVLSVAHRSTLGIWRDRTGLAVTAFLPIFLALLISFTQARQSMTTFASFFLVVAALWMGMTLTVREIVNERKLYVRDRLAGLTPEAFLCGKLAVFVAAACLQALVLHCITRVLLSLLVSWNMAHQTAYSIFLPAPTVVVLPCVAAGGVLLGFIVSTLAATEQTAVSCLPLLLLPQVLMSRVAAGFGNETWDTPNPFTSINRIPEFLSKLFSGESGFLNDVWNLAMFIASQPLFTRPGTSALDNVEKIGLAFGGELVVLATLLFVHLVVWALVFGMKEKSWTIR